MKGNFNRRLKLDFKWPFAPYRKHRPSTVRNNKKLDSKKERRILNHQAKKWGDADGNTQD